MYCLNFQVFNYKNLIQPVISVSIVPGINQTLNCSIEMYFIEFLEKPGITWSYAVEARD